MLGRKLHKSPRPDGLCPMKMGAFNYTRFWWVVVVVVGFRVFRVVVVVGFRVLG
jgi:hypothetical protein